MVVLIDNYDSFVHNLARYVRELGHETTVVRNDVLRVDELAEMEPSHIVISPGPCTPNEAGISVAAVRRLGPRVPILGICLGHQSIGQAFGARIVRARRPMHGKTSLVRHDGQGVFTGLPNPLRGTRYHSLVVEPDDLPPELIVTAWSEEDEIMGLRHREHPIVALQFHPEAVLTEGGYELLGNFLAGSSSSSSPRRLPDRQVSIGCVRGAGPAAPYGS